MRSGRDGDKIKAAGLTVEYTKLGNPTFAEGRLMIECRKIYNEQIDSAIMDITIKKRFYEDYKQTVFFDSGYNILPKYQMFEFLA